MINIADRLHSTATEQTVAGANEIYDDAKGKKQDVINQENDEHFSDLEDESVRVVPQEFTQTEQAQARQNLNTYSKNEVNQIASAFTEQNYVSVQAVAATTAADIATLINATGEGERTDTIYRVGWFDGTAFDVTKYSEYTWNGSSYIQMAVRSTIGEVFDISVYNQSGGTPVQYETLALALGTNGANVPSGVRQGGMSVKFIQSSDNKYVQYRLMANDWSINIYDWSFCGDDVLIENSKYISVLCDSDNRILAWIRKEDGGIDWAVGVPEPVRNYIIYMLNSKVDKVEGKSLIPTQYIQEIENTAYVEIVTDNDQKILEATRKDGKKIIYGDLEVRGLINDVNIKEVEEKVNKIVNSKPIKVLIIGDSYSADGSSQWIAPMMSKFPEGSSYISLAVGSASVKDHYANRAQYPYTSRPVSSDVSGNKNTFACQIEKLKRLMAGVDLDEGETQIYTSVDDYPDVIIIEGGMNDGYDTDEVVASYKNQFVKKVTNVYYRPAYGNNPVLGDTFIKTPSDEVDRTCFAGAYRYLADELTSLFPNAQIFFTTRSGLGYWSYDVVNRSVQIANQQRLCADYCGFPIIDWHNDAQISVINNYPNGDGSQNNPYTQGLGVHGSDTYDSMHPIARGGKKYGTLAALVIKQRLLNF